MLHPGDRIGEWEIVLPLGQGGMGSVFRCRHGLSARIEAAVKILSATDVPGARERFIREAEALHKLRHPAIVRITGFGQDPKTDLLWLAMEIVHGRDLSHVLEGGGILPERIADVFGPVAEGLAYAHRRGIVHRDIKPANLMIQDDGTPVLLDFGIAVQEGQDRLTQEGMVPGTIAYAAPDQLVAGRMGAPEAADMYALGQVLCECLTGEFTFPRDPSIPEHRRAVRILREKLKLGPLDPGEAFDPRIRELVRGATDPDPAERGPPLAQWAQILSAGPILVDDEGTVIQAVPAGLRGSLDPSGEGPLSGDEEVIVARSVPPPRSGPRRPRGPMPSLPPDVALPASAEVDPPGPNLHEAETEVNVRRRAVWVFVLASAAIVVLLGGGLILVAGVGGAAAWWSMQPGRPAPEEPSLDLVIKTEEPVDEVAGIEEAPTRVVRPPELDPAPAATAVEPRTPARTPKASTAGPQGLLVVGSDRTAGVQLDGAFLRDTPVTRRLPAGTYSVRLDGKGAGRKDFRVTLEPGETARRVWSFGDGEWRSFEGGIDESGLPARPAVSGAQAKVDRSEAVKACLDAHPLAERVRLSFIVVPDGSVMAEGLSGDLEDSAVDGCLKKAVRTLSFGRSQAGAAVTVRVGG